MKKKQKEPLSSKYMGAILTAILVVGMGGILLMNSDSSPQFKITKEVCANETVLKETIHKVEEGYSVWNETLEIRPGGNLEILRLRNDQHVFLQKDKGRKWSRPEISRFVSATYYDYETGEIMSHWGILDQDKRPIFKNNRQAWQAESLINPSEYWVDLTISWRAYYERINATSELVREEVCDDVEVEEIDYFKDVTETNPTCEGAVILVVDCEINNKTNCIYGPCLQFEKALKEELTTEWLDENAECKEGRICSQWKLGDYIIETFEEEK